MTLSVRYPAEVTSIPRSAPVRVRPPYNHHVMVT